MKSKLQIVVLVIFTLLVCTSVYAEEDYFTMEHYTDPTAIASVGGDVTLTVKIAHDNNSAYVMSDVEVYKGSNLIISFGNIYAGQEVTKSGRLNVSASETSGVALTLKYSENGQRQVTKDFTVKFSQVQETMPTIKYSCNLSKTTGESDDTVTLTYRVENVGSVHIYDVKIEDDAFGSIKTLPILKTGQNTQAVYTTKINNGFTSVPRLTYTVGTTTYKESLDSVDVTAGNPDLELEVTANKMIIAPGDTLTVSCTITNPGTADLEKVVISEAISGELPNTEGLVAGESQTRSYDMVVTESITLYITAIGDNGGEKEWVVSKELDIVVDDGLQALGITIEAVASINILEYPGIVRFDITISNTSNEIYKNLKVMNKDEEIIKEIPQLVPGEDKFYWNTNVEQSGTYFFTLSVPNDEQEYQHISTTPIDITIQSDDSQNTSGQTQEPSASFVPTEFDGGTKELFANSKILLVILIVVILIIVGAVASFITRIRR